MVYAHDSPWHEATVECLAHLMLMQTESVAIALDTWDMADIAQNTCDCDDNWSGLVCYTPVCEPVPEKLASFKHEVVSSACAIATQVTGDWVYGEVILVLTSPACACLDIVFIDPLT